MLITTNNGQCDERTSWRLQDTLSSRDIKASKSSIIIVDLAAIRDPIGVQ
jgi:hypothetical protein